MLTKSELEQRAQKSDVEQMRRPFLRFKQLPQDIVNVCIRDNILIQVQEFSDGGCFVHVNQADFNLVRHCLRNYERVEGIYHF